MTRRFTVLFRAAGRELPALQLNIDTLCGECSVLRCTQRLRITPRHISRLIVGTLKLEATSRTFVYGLSRVSPLIRARLQTTVLIHSLEMSYANH